MPPICESANVTVGFRCAPEMRPSARMRATRAAPVAIEFSSSCRPTSCGLSRWAAIPEPTMAMRSSAVPTNSATARRNIGATGELSRRAFGPAFDYQHERTEAHREFLGRLLEGQKAFCLRPHDNARIRETPMDAFGIAWEDGAQLTSAIAERDDVIECLIRELVHVLGALGADVDAHVLERLYRQQDELRW